MIGWRIFPWQARAIFVSQSSEALRLLGCCPFRCGCWLVLLFPRRQIPSRLDLRDGGFQPSLRIPLNTWLLIGYPLSWSHHHLSTVISCNYPRISSGHPGLAWYMFCLSRAGPAGPCFNIRRAVEKSKAATAIHLRQEATASHPIGEKGDVVTVESFVHQRHNSLPHFLVNVGNLATLLACVGICHILCQQSVNKVRRVCIRSSLLSRLDPRHGTHGRMDTAEAFFPCRTHRESIQNTYDHTLD